MNVLNSLKVNSHRVFEKALAEHVFPGAAMGVAQGVAENRRIFLNCFGHTSYAGEKKVEVRTIYDLASLTKPLATAVSLLCLMKEGKIRLSDRLEMFFPDAVPVEKRDITVAALLGHASGYPAHRPYFQELMAATNRGERLFDLLMREPLVHEPGSISLYSDLGFMLLGLIIEKTSGIGQDAFFRQKITDPLGLSEKIFFAAADGSGIRGGDPGRTFAATEECPLRNRLLRGEVSDENAFALGGVAGHAGLFGTIEGVLHSAVHLLDQWKGREEHPGYRSSDLRILLQKQGIPGSTWALGFDTPSVKGSSSGRYLSAESVGHLGFTGTSFWIDPARDLVLVLLSNRVHPSRENEKIKAFRPLFHDMVLESLGLAA